MNTIKQDFSQMYACKVDRLRTFGEGKLCRCGCWFIRRSECETCLNCGGTPGESTGHGTEVDKGGSCYMHARHRIADSYGVSYGRRDMAFTYNRIMCGSTQ